MKRISVRLPPSLHHHMRQIAKREKISMNQFVIRAVMEKIEALNPDYLAERAKRGSHEKLIAALDKVSDVEPEEYDQL